jgi:hypothetical protein
VVGRVGVVNLIVDEIVNNMFDEKVFLTYPRFGAAADGGPSAIRVWIDCARSRRISGLS